jgi:hypothetical protein
MKMVQQLPEGCPNCGDARWTATERPSGLPAHICPHCGQTADASVAGDTRAERALYKAWVNRLAAKSDETRDPEIDALVALGARAVPPLSRLLKDKWAAVRAKEAAVLVLGRIGSQESVEVLLETSAAQERSALTLRRWVPVGLSVMVLMVALGLVLPLVLGDKPVFNAGMVAPFIATFAAAASVLGLRKGAANALGELREPRAIGPLALAATEKAMPPTALPVLKVLLPDATEELAASLDRTQREAVVKLLRQPDTELVRGALRLVGMFGGTGEREAVERVRTEGPPELVPDAESALAAIGARIELEKDRETPLRASTSTESSPETLLRPAASLPDPQPEQLLRASDSPVDE